MLNNINTIIIILNISQTIIFIFSEATEARFRNSQDSLIDNPKSSQSIPKQLQDSLKTVIY